MNESYSSERQISNQTATFTKIPNEEPFKAQSSHFLSSIPEEPEPTNLQSSLLMPQPLIKRPPKDQSDLQFVNRLNKEYSQKAEESMTRQKANITFYPSLANRILYEQSTLQSLKEQEGKLKGELSAINEMITDLVNKKSDLANEYEEIIRERKCYKRLKKNLEQEYEGYLFMLDGDYCQKLDEETQRQRQVLIRVRKEVHALNAELSKPSNVKDVYKDTQPAEEKEKEYYELQITEEKRITNNKRKQERLATLLQKNKEKEADIKQITKKIDKLEYERMFEDEDPVESQQLAANYEELAKKLAKLKKIRDTNSKVKEMQFYRKVKESKEKELAIVQLDHKIDNMNEKLYKILLELDQEKELHSKASTYKEKANTKPKAKRTTSQFRDQKLFNSQKNKLTLPSEFDPRRRLQQSSSRNLARVQTEPIDSNQDRPQLLMRRKKIYTQLERNQYFKNIQNSEQEKLSRIHEFDNKDYIAISSYDKFQREAERRGLRLPQIQSKLKTDGNESIIYNYKSVPQKKLNKRSIQLHNRNMHHLRANRSSPKHHIPNYQQLCAALNRERLLIEEDLQYDLSQLIYSGHS